MVPSLSRLLTLIDQRHVIKLSITSSSRRLLGLSPLLCRFIYLQKYLFTYFLLILSPRCVVWDVNPYELDSTSCKVDIESIRVFFRQRCPALPARPGPCGRSPGIAGASGHVVPEDGRLSFSAWPSVTGLCGAVEFIDADRSVALSRGLKRTSRDVVL